MIKNIFFDFDGVILDSMEIRDQGFKEIFKEFHESDIEEFLEYHRTNGGLSRFHKIKYFYKNYLNIDIDDKKINKMAEKFSVIMRVELIKEKYLIQKTLDFIKHNYNRYNFFIVSGSEEKELKFLCKELKIDKYFKDILGSPIHKNELVLSILEKEKLNSEECILIGDSINDYEAAKVNKIDFYGFNNEKLREISKKYIENFESFN